MINIVLYVGKSPTATFDLDKFALTTHLTDKLRCFFGNQKHCSTLIILHLIDISESSGVCRCSENAKLNVILFKARVT